MLTGGVAREGAEAERSDADGRVERARERRRGTGCARQESGIVQREEGGPGRVRIRERDRLARVMLCSGPVRIALIDKSFASVRFPLSTSMAPSMLNACAVRWA